MSGDVEDGAARKPLKVGAWQLVEDAKTRIDNLSIDEVKAEVEAGALLIDIRDVRERAKLGTIPGSTHVARGLLEFWADPDSEYYHDFFDPERRTILYCAGGGRSALAADVLRYMGFDSVGHLECGFTGWRDAGEAVDEA